MRLLTLVVGLCCLSGPLQAQTLNLLQPAPGQDDSLSLGVYRAPFDGARPLDLSVGIGSAAFRDRHDPEAPVYTLSDRGPNFTCGDAEEVLGVAKEAACPAGEGVKAGTGRLYPRPNFTVSIYRLALDEASGTFRVTERIQLSTPKGRPITGLTNPLQAASTEVPRDGDGRVLAQDANALDAEGLVRLADGRFFIGEENAPSVAEVSPEGVVVRRFVPAGTEGDLAAADYPVAGSLPAILARRQSNRGIESLALGDDGRTLYAMVQNPLANPDRDAYAKAVNTRFLALELGRDASGATTLTPVGEYVYQLSDWHEVAALGATDAKSASSLRVSEVLALGGDRFMVLERTDQVTRLYEISLAGATNILGTAWDDAATSPSLEQTVDLAAQGVTPVGKILRLTASSLEGADPRFPEKLEGLALMPDGRLLVINDDDFGISGQRTAVGLVGGLDLGGR